MKLNKKLMRAYRRAPQRSKDIFEIARKYHIKNKREISRELTREGINLEEWGNILGIGAFTSSLVGSVTAAYFLGEEAYFMPLFIGGIASTLPFTIGLQIRGWNYVDRNNFSKRWHQYHYNHLNEKLREDESSKTKDSIESLTTKTVEKCSRHEEYEKNPQANYCGQCGLKLERDLSF